MDNLDLLFGEDVKNSFFFAKNWLFYSTIKFTIYNKFKYLYENLMDLKFRISPLGKNNL